MAVAQFRRGGNESLQVIAISETKRDSFRTAQQLSTETIFQYLLHHFW
jgi:hypothetical protein